MNYNIKGLPWPVSFTAEQEKRAAALGVALPLDDSFTMFEVDEQLSKDITAEVNEVIETRLREALDDRIGSGAPEGKSCDERNGEGAFDALIASHTVKVTAMHSRKQGQVYRKISLEKANLNVNSILSGTPTASTGDAGGVEDF